MGAWSTSINGNDTAEDLKQEYTVAFWKFEVPEALRLLDEYVRQDFDESDPEEWVNYYYSLADFMWKKGILTDEVRDKAVAMIDSGFGLDLWEEAGKRPCDRGKKFWLNFGKSCFLLSRRKRPSSPTSMPSAFSTMGTLLPSSCKQPESPIPKTQ